MPVFKILFFNHSMQKLRVWTAVSPYVSTQGKARTLETDLSQKVQRANCWEQENLSEEKVGPEQRQTILWFTTGPVTSPVLCTRKEEKTYQNPSVFFFFFCILMCIVTLKLTTLALERLNILMVKTKRELWMMTLICWSRRVLIRKGVSILTRFGINSELDAD